MVLIIIFLGLFVLYMASKGVEPRVKRCWDAAPGESKVHKWVLQDVPGSKQIVLVCAVCGQKPGGE